MPCIPVSSPSIQHQLHHHRVLAGVGMGCGAEAAVAAAGTTGMMCGAHDGEVPAEVARHHEHAEPGSDQCCSAVVQHVAAPAAAVWSVVRRFDQPQAYKRFVRSCALVAGDGGVGTLREVHVVSGLPAASSRERLEILDDESHVLSFRIVSGEHRLKNYLSVTTVHPSPAAPSSAKVVVESYVVEAPAATSHPPPSRVPWHLSLFPPSQRWCGRTARSEQAQATSGLCAGARHPSGRARSNLAAAMGFYS